MTRSLATLLIENATPTNTFVRYDSLLPELMGPDGQAFQYNDMLAGSGVQPFAREIKPGEQVRVRLYFTVPNDATPKTLTLKQSDGRAYEYQLQ